MGYDHIDIKAANDLGIPVGHTPEVLSDSTSDFTIGMIIAASRKIPQGFNAIKKGGLEEGEQSEFYGRAFTKKTLGIVGLGRIGSRVARKFKKGWGDIRVVFCDIVDKSELEKELGLERLSFDEVLR